MSARPIDAVVIGASAGAVDAFMEILPEIPREGASPIVSVIHVPRDRESLLIELFQPKCLLDVKEVEDKEPLVPGTLYLAPPDYDILIEPDHTLSLSSDERVLFSRPSIDVLFESAADAFGDRLLGIILTGASPDGAHGLAKVYSSGGQAIVQRPSSAFAAEMPRSALNACPEASVMELSEIGEYLKGKFGEVAR